MTYLKRVPSSEKKGLNIAVPQLELNVEWTCCSFVEDYYLWPEKAKS